MFPDEGQASDWFESIRWPDGNEVVSSARVGRDVHCGLRNADTPLLSVMSDVLLGADGNGHEVIQTPASQVGDRSVPALDQPLGCEEP